MLEAYFDESGKAGKNIVVSGYVASPTQWQKVIRALNRIFPEYKIDYLHMKEINNPDSTHYLHLKPCTRVTR